MKTLTITTAALTVVASLGAVTAASATERATLKIKPVKMQVHCPCPDGWVTAPNGVCIPNRFKIEEPFDH